MDLLLDTHSFIWYVENEGFLSEDKKNLIDQIENEIFISIATLWEISINSSIGKLNLSYDLELIIDKTLANGFNILQINTKDILLVSKLPFHHRDPFDRLIIAQSITNQIPVIGKDIIFKEYGVNLIW